MCVHTRGGYNRGTDVSSPWLFTLTIGLMAFAGDHIEMALLFFLQTAFFVILGYLKFTERTYILLFWAYMIVTFTGFSYWTVFIMGKPL